MTPSDPQGIDCVWLAIDQDGRVGAFFTGGEGPIPSSALSAAIADPALEGELETLPVIATTQMLVDYKRPDSFIAMGQRGLYVFDWRDVHQTSTNLTNKYSLVCEPSAYLRLEELPPHLKAIAGNTRLGNTNYAGCRTSGLNVC